MTQLRIGDAPQQDRPYVPLQVKPDPALVAQGNYITQHVNRICAYCQTPLGMTEKLGSLPSVTVINESQEHHNETCPAYRRNRITVDDADGHLPVGPDVRAVAPRHRSEAA